MSQSLNKEPGTAMKEACQKRREEILDAATSLFAEKGFSEADTQLLADRLQVGKGTLYRHFPSKTELFLAAADRVMRRLHDAMEASTQGVEDPLEQVDRAIRAYLDFFDQHPEYVELLIQERAQFKDRPTPTYFLHRERNVEKWRNRYRDLIAQGRLRQVPVQRISDVIAAAVYGSIFLNYFSGQPGTFRAGAEDILDIIFHGILNRSEQDGSRSAAPGRPVADRDAQAGATTNGEEA